ncbi:MAG TPA: hypothetical protein PKC45_06610 [Gemmatales bacterium]|nr:hypothetical protein [Gemmatales bacterium]
MSPDAYEQLRNEWTDQYVQADLSRPELKRFEGQFGLVRTVNWNGKCLVDFADGAWYDIAPAFLKKVEASEAQGKFDATMNSAQPLPSRQG